MSAASRAWVEALRLRTLPAGAAPVLVGLGLAWGRGFFDPLVATVCLAAALLIQIGVNLANDYFDHRSGVDRADRLGPARVTGKVLPERSVFAAMVLVLAMATLLGAWLALRGGWPIVVIGVLSIAGAILYAGGPWPLGHHGLGEVLVFAFFGPIAVAGTFYLQAGGFPFVAWVSGIPLGALAACILIVNNVRDIPTDARAGKRTLAVRLGPRGAWALYAALLGVAYAVPVGGWLAHGQGLTVLAPLLTLPLAVATLRSCLAAEGAALNPLLARTALLLAAFGVLFAGGLAL